MLHKNYVIMFVAHTHSLFFNIRTRADREGELRDKHVFFRDTTITRNFLTTLPRCFANISFVIRLVRICYRNANAILASARIIYSSRD